MSERMSNAPVYYALVQARFNPVRAMAKYVDNIQDMLRKQGYSLFEHTQVLDVQVNADREGEQVAPVASKSTIWLITRNDRRCGFLLDRSAISFHTTHYETHIPFFRELLHGLKAVHDVVGLEHLQRIGLRYLNAIQPEPGESIDDYLVEGLRGISINHPLRQASQQSVFTTDAKPLFGSSTLISRVYHRKNAHLDLPPDLLKHNLSTMERFSSQAATDHAVVDIDHYAQGQAPLDVEQLEQLLNKLHETVRMVFRKTTTPHAHAKWA